tara:strand:+ start:546 stop:755 length:210 start_codon:yes stop_codon:yes gene_type:complete
MTFNTVFTPLHDAVNSAEKAYDSAWLDLLNYKGAERMEVIALENALQACYVSLQASREAFDNTYYSLPQ